jgi:hypothetical protein
MQLTRNDCPQKHCGSIAVTFAARRASSDHLPSAHATDASVRFDSEPRQIVGT